MKIFVSGRFPDIKNIKEILKNLKANGHEIIFDWTIKGNLKPYSLNTVRARNFSIKAIKSINESDIFIFVTHPQIAGGSSVELGAAINSYEIRKKPKIFMVGKSNTSVVFYYHPAVNKRKDIKQVIQEIQR